MIRSKLSSKEEVKVSGSMSIGLGRDKQKAKGVYG